MIVVKCWDDGRLKVGYVRVLAVTVRLMRTTSGSSRPSATVWPKMEVPTSAVSFSKQARKKKTFEKVTQILSVHPFC